MNCSLSGPLLACPQIGAYRLSKEGNILCKVSTYSSGMTRRVAGFKYLSFLLKLRNERRTTNEPLMLKSRKTLWFLFCSGRPLLSEYTLFKLLGKLWFLKYQTSRENFKMYFCSLYFWSQPAFKIFPVTIHTQTYILIRPSHTIIYCLGAESLKQHLC